MVEVRISNTFVYISKIRKPRELIYLHSCYGPPPYWASLRIQSEEFSFFLKKYYLLGTDSFLLSTDV